jgi:hypothetical protein
MGEPETDATTHWLQQFLDAHEGVAGTVHRRVGTGDDAMLHLAAAVNIPPKVREITARIPHGKGMAGLAWARDAPVQTCNLQDDRSGDVRPGAKAVDARGAVALPVHDDQGDLVAVVGIAYADARELDEPALAKLRTAAASLPSA